MYVCPFLTDPKYRKTRVDFLVCLFVFSLILNFVFLNKNVEKNVRIYSNCPKMVFQPDIMEYNPFHIKKKSTYLPSQFSGQKGKQTFYFLGLMEDRVGSFALSL